MGQSSTPTNSYEELHDFASGRDLSDHLKRAAGLCYGTAGPAFIEAFVRDRERSLARVREVQDAFVDAHVSPSADGQVSRVATHFGLIAAAGELTIKFGILPLTPGAAKTAASAAFNAWLEQRGGDMPAEAQQVLQRAEELLSRDGQARFEPIIKDERGKWISDPANGNRTIPNRAGYVIKNNGKSESDHSPSEPGQYRYLVFRHVFEKEIAQGVDKTYAAQILQEHGILVKGDPSSFTTSLRVPGGAKERLYDLRK